MKQNKRNVRRRKAHYDGGLKETMHLLRSPRNAQRLLAALRRAERAESNPSPR